MKNKKEMLTKQQREDFGHELQKYFDENLDESISSLQAALLVGFIEENLGKYFYNKGVEDSMVAIKDKVDDLFLIMEE